MTYFELRVEPGGERPRFRDRYVGIDRGDRALDVRQQRGRIARDPDVGPRILCNPIASVLLPEVQVRNRIRLLPRASPLQVFHDADDFNAVGPDGDPEWHSTGSVPRQGSAERWRFLVALALLTLGHSFEGSG